MGALLHRWGSFCAHHAAAVLLFWVAAVVVVGLLVSQAGAQTDNDLTLPGTDSQRAYDLLADEFPPQQNGSSAVVFHSSGGKVTDAAHQSAIESSVAAIAKQPHVANATDPFANSQAGLISKDAATAFTPVLLDVSAGDLDEETAQAVVDAARPAVAAGLTVEVGGPIGSFLSEPSTESSEVVGLLAAMTILAITFGSLVAMGMPIITAVVGLLLGLGVVGLLGHLWQIPSVGPTLATMIGLGVGIDYALFLVSRHREQLAAGTDVKESVARTIATSGNAVLFAGGTVVIALLSLGVAGIPFVTSLGIASAVAVLTAVLASMSLLPALLALLGHGILRLRLPRFMRPAPKPVETTLWGRWGRTVTRHPWISAVVALALLAPLIAPMFAITLGQEDIGVAPRTTTERAAFDLMADGFGPGYNGPLVVASRLVPPAAPSADYTKRYDQATAMKADLEQKQKALSAEASTLTADQRALEEQQAALLAQQSSLEEQRDALQGQQAALERRKAKLERQQAKLERDSAALATAQAALEEQAAALRTEARALAADARRLAGVLRREVRALAANTAEQAVVRRAHDDAAGDPVVTARLEARLATLQAEAATLRASIASTRAALRQDARTARALEREAVRLARQERAIVAEAAALQRRADALTAQANQLRRDANRLTAQGAALRSEADALAAEGDALQKQADTLTARAADLKQQQADAEAEQKQAEQLQDELTDELTKAGGDARGTDPRLVAEQDALLAIGTGGGVQVVGPPVINKSGSAAYFSVVPTTRPADPLTATLVTHLREDVLPPVEREQKLVTFVGGTTAANVDLAALISRRLPVVILTVLVLSFLLLMVAFRSLLVPLQAAITNLLTVGAAFGVLTACFQWGWGLDLVGLDSPYDTVPIASYVPLMMFAALFGLSMDYEVFLVSQIQHAHLRGASPRAAVRRGVTAAAKVVTAAALIMMAVFGSFVLNGDPTVKQFGVGLSVAVFLAGLMALVFAPALLVLFGRGTFWLPGVLDRVLPHLDVEGEDRDAGEVEGPVPQPAAASRPEPA